MASEIEIEYIKSILSQKFVKIYYKRLQSCNIKCIYF